MIDQPPPPAPSPFFFPTNKNKITWSPPGFIPDTIQKEIKGGKGPWEEKVEWGGGRVLPCYDLGTVWPAGEKKI